MLFPQHAQLPTRPRLAHHAATAGATSALSVVAKSSAVLFPDDASPFGVEAWETKRGQATRALC